MSEVAEEEITEEINEEIVENIEAVEKEEVATAPEENNEEIIEDEIEISIGDESLTSEEEDDSKAPEWVKDVRNSNRELKKQNKQYQKELEDYKRSMEPKAPVVGDKPTLEGCDYDEEKFEVALTSYQERKRASEDEQKSQQRQIEEEKKAWNDKLTQYDEAKKSLKVKNYDEAEEVALSSLDPTQQGILVQGAENSALLVYAIGKNPKRAEELSKIKDPVKFAFAVAKMEKDLKVTTKKRAVAPEGKIRGSAPISGSVDNRLNKLRSDSSSDRSKILEYRRAKQRSSR